MSRSQRLMLHALTCYPVSRMWQFFMRSRAAVVMLHRFFDPERGVPGHDPRLLRAALARLRHERYELVELRELLRRIEEGKPAPRPMVAFTMDDGYLEQATVGAQIFGEFDCPVTTFVTTGFLDGALWFWWDRIEYILRHTTLRALEVELDGTRLCYTRDAVSGYGAAQADFTGRCKQVPEKLKLKGIEHLAAAAEVEVPRRAPLGYEAMSWNDVRSLEQKGMRFGAQTVTHPILSRTTEDQSRCEILGSWERLCSQARDPVPIFCYPNGQPPDYGAREINTLRRASFMAAVVATSGCVAKEDFQLMDDGRFRIRRFAYLDDLPILIQCVSGLEQFKNAVRRLPGRSVS